MSDPPEPVRIPLFPLPGVVLFPGTLLPLHIFEPRYRTMVSRALTGDRVIGMAMLDGEPAKDSPPPVLAVGGAGRIVEHEELEDGRFNIILEGVYRFRILGEEPTEPFRTARVEVLSAVDYPDPGLGARAIAEVLHLFGELQSAMDLPPLPSEELSAERLSGELALRLRWPPSDLQRILTLDALSERFDAIRERLAEWKSTADFLRPYRAETNPLAN